MTSSNCKAAKTVEELGEWQLLPSQKILGEVLSLADLGKDAEEWVLDFSAATTEKVSAPPALVRNPPPGISDPISSTTNHANPRSQHEPGTRLGDPPNFEIGFERNRKKEYMLVYIPIEPDTNGLPRWGPATAADYAAVPGLVAFIKGLAPRAVDFGPEGDEEGVIRVVGGKLGW